MCGQLGPLTFTLQPQWANTLACRTAMLSASTWTTRSVATIWRRPPGWVRLFVWTCVRSSCYFHSKWYGESGGLIHGTSGLKNIYISRSSHATDAFVCSKNEIVHGCFLCSSQSAWHRLNVHKSHIPASSVDVSRAAEELQRLGAFMCSVSASMWRLKRRIS